MDLKKKEIKTAHTRLHMRRRRIAIVFFGFIAVCTVVFAFTDLRYFWGNRYLQKRTIHAPDRTFKISDDALTALAFSPDGKYLAIGDSRAKIKILDLSSFEITQTIDVYPEYNQFYRVSPDGSLVFSLYGDNRINRIWSTETGELLGDFGDESAGFIINCVSNDNRYLVFDETEEKFAMSIWSIPDRKKICDIESSIDRKLTQWEVGKGISAFTNDGSLFVYHSKWMGSEKDVVHVWDTQSGALLWSKKSEKHIGIYPERKLLATHSDEESPKVKLYDLLTGNVMHDDRFDQFIRFIPYRSSKLIFVNDAKECFYYDEITDSIHKLPWTTNIHFLIQNDHAYRSKFKDGKKLVDIWSLTDEKIVLQLELEDEDVSNSVIISPDCKFYASIEDNAIRVYLVETGDLVHTFRYDKSIVSFHEYEFAIDGNRIFKPQTPYFLSERREGTIIVFVLGETYRTQVFQSYVQLIVSLQYSPDGKYLLSVSSDDSIQIIDIDTGSIKRTIEEDGIRIRKAAINSTADLIATRSISNIIYIWSYETGKILRKLEGEQLPIRDIDFSPDGQMIAGCTPVGTLQRISSNELRGGLWIWDAYTGELLKHFDKSFATYKLAFSNDAKYVATTGIRVGVEIWYLNDRYKMGRAWSGYGSFVDTSFDGKYIATCSDGRCSIVNSRSGDMVAFFMSRNSYREHDDSPRRVRRFNSFAFSPVDYTFITGDSLGNLDIWDIGAFLNLPAGK